MEKASVDILTRECLTEDCGKAIELEELKAKLSGEPDFFADDHYCAGAGSYCEDADQSACSS